jgi:DNA-binding IclR family transcriptional regulator
MATRRRRQGGKAAVQRNSTRAQPVARAIRVVRLLALGPGARSLAQISEEVGLHKATAMRLLRTLTAEGVVQKAPQRRFHLLHPAYRLLVASRR